MPPISQPYGSWKSPISSLSLVEKLSRLSGVHVNKDSLFWLELRPSEKGRVVVCSLPLKSEKYDAFQSWTIADHNATTRVHEYGGGSYTVSEDGQVFYSNNVDQHVYRQTSPDAQPECLVHPESQWRFADYIHDSRRNALFCVAEDHSKGENAEPRNCIVSLDLSAIPCTPQVVVEGCDFYSNPRISPDGKHLCWVQWNHPNMPWDSTHLCVADLSPTGSELVPNTTLTVAGGLEESVISPIWSPKNELTFASDRSDWWNLYQYPKDSWDPKSVRALCPQKAEFTDSGDIWNFGGSSFCFDPSGDNLLVRFSEGAETPLFNLEVASGKLTRIETGYTGHSQIRWANNGLAYLLASSPVKSTALISVRPKGGAADAKVIRTQQAISVDSSYFSAPKSISFPTTNGLTANAYLYLPHNPDYVGTDGERPPLLVKIHGGPTSQCSSAFNMLYQYWTSRGFAILDVNYGGSTGYGRKYRNRLLKSWGIVDVDDACNGALYVANELKQADANRLAIDGGSAGGFTTLACITFRDVFKAGCSNYGVADLTALTNDTHKFESRYLDGLVGPYPQDEAIYRERSPIHHVDRLNCPIILFQGGEDKIVPPNQAELMYDAVKKKGIPVAYVLFPNERHGFRVSENIQRQVDGEFYFFSRIFHFQPADTIEPVPIDNLK